MSDQPGCPCSICEEDTLRTRIAAALEGRVAPDYGLTLADVADLVIAALGLKQQSRYGFHRCVTEWQPDE